MSAVPPLLRPVAGRPCSVLSLVERSGGVPVFAMALGVHERSVYRWIKANRISRGYELAAMRYAERMGVSWRPITVSKELRKEIITTLAWAF